MSWGFLSVLKGSWVLFWRSIKTLFIAALVLGGIYAVAVHVTTRSMQYDTGRLMQGFGLSEERLRDLARRAEEGDEGAMLQLMQEVDSTAARFRSMTQAERNAHIEEQARAAYSGLGSRLALFSLISLLLALAGMLYSLIAYLEDHEHVLEVIRRTAHLFFSMMSVWLWVFVRSGLWLMFLGLIPFLHMLLPVGVLLAAVAGAILLPLYMVAPAVLVSERTSPADAVKRSFARSRGHWGKIVLLTTGVVSVVTVVHMMLVAGFNAMPLAADRNLMLFLSGAIQQLTVAFFAAFLVELSRRLAAART